MLLASHLRPGSLAPDFKNVQCAFMFMFMFISCYFQAGSFWQRPGISCPGFRPGVCHSNRHRPGDRVPYLSSREPLGPVYMDTSSRAGGTRCCWAYQRSLHWWVCSKLVQSVVSSLGIWSVYQNSPWKLVCSSFLRNCQLYLYHTYIQPGLFILCVTVNKCRSVSRFLSKLDLNLMAKFYPNLTNPMH